MVGLALKNEIEFLEKRGLHRDDGDIQENNPKDLRLVSEQLTPAVHQIINLDSTDQYPLLFLASSLAGTISIIRELRSFKDEHMDRGVSWQEQALSTLSQILPGDVASELPNQTMLGRILARLQEQKALFTRA